jgi:hypothetical protein
MSASSPATPSEALKEIPIDRLPIDKETLVFSSGDAAGWTGLKRGRKGD